jgi:hypothetical protein
MEERNIREILLLIVLILCTNSSADMWENKTITQDGQLVNSDHYVEVFIHDTQPDITHFTVYGGQIGTVKAYDNSITTIQGGIFSANFYSHHPENNDGDNLSYCPLSSRIYAYDQSTIIFLSGDLQISMPKDGTINCTDFSHVIVKGGTCGITALKNSVVDIYDGIINGITTNNFIFYPRNPIQANSIFHVRGGTFTKSVYLTSDSRMYIYGYNFNYESQTHKLTGQWQNGSEFEIMFSNLFDTNSYDRVVLMEIPEPVSMGIFVFIFGSLLLNKK